MYFRSKSVEVLYAQLRGLVRDRRRNDEGQGLQELVLNISEGCNLTCPYCFAGQGKYGSDRAKWMSPEVARDSVLDFLSRHRGVKTIKLFGGEPFMNIPAMEATFGAVDEMRHDLAVIPSIGCVTNMTIYSPRIVELCGRGLSFSVSVDGPPEIHDINRRFVNGKGSFMRITSTLQKYRNAGFDAASIDTVYTPLHFLKGWSIGSIVQYLRDVFQVPGVVVVPYYDPDLGVPEEEFADAVRGQAEDAIYSAVVSGTKKDLMMQDVRRVLTMPTPSSGWCDLGRSTVTVMADGAVLPCYTVAGRRSSWQWQGDSSVYVSKRMLPLLEEANPRKLLICEGCHIREVCRGCPGGNYACGGEFTDKVASRCAFKIGSIEGYLRGKIDAQDVKRDE